MFLIVLCVDMMKSSFIACTAKADSQAEAGWNPLLKWYNFLDSEERKGKSLVIERQAELESWSCPSMLSTTHLLQSPNVWVRYWSVNGETIGHMFTQHLGQPSREPSPSCQWNRVVKKITGLGGSLCAMNVLVSNVNLLTNPTSAYKVATGLMLCREESDTNQTCAIRNSS